MPKAVCKECSKEFDGEGGLHKHLKAHSLSQTVYYQTHFPRYDLFDGSIIKFKNKEQYFTSIFNSKSNFNQWIKSISPDKGKEYVIEFLKNRKEKKGLVFAPTQVELKTLMMPGIKFINEKLGCYEEICDELGLQVRFSKTSLNESLLFKDISKKVIFTDTREQNPLDFDVQTRTKGMKFGDYRMADSSIYIERKSVNDAWGTLTGGFERFEREIIRAADAEAYLVVLIECPFVALEEFPNLRQIRGKINIPVEFVYHSIRELSQKYQHIQFLFVKDRDEASRVTKKLFAADLQVKDVDLQLLYDIGGL